MQVFISWQLCQERFLWIHKEVELAAHPVVGRTPGRRCREVSSCTCFRKSGSSIIRVSKQGTCFTAIKEDGGNKRRVQFELACKADGVAPPDPVWSCHCLHCWGIPDEDYCLAGARKHSSTIICSTFITAWTPTLSSHLIMPSSSKGVYKVQDPTCSAWLEWTHQHARSNINVSCSGLWKPMQREQELFFENIMITVHGSSLGGIWSHFSLLTVSLLDFIL